MVTRSAVSSRVSAVSCAAGSCRGNTSEKSRQQEPSPNSQPGSKRPRCKSDSSNPEGENEDDHDYDPNIALVTNSFFFPFIQIKPAQRSDECLSKLHCVAVNKIMRKNGLNPIKTTRKQNMLNLHIDSPEECKKLLNMKEFGGHKVKVEVHPSLNQSKGVVRHKEFEIITQDAMEETDNVIEAYQITRTSNGVTTKTGTWILTFCTPICPKLVDVGFVKRIPVSVYIPKPMKCHNCQRFGHTKKRCKGKARCSQCGEAPHGSKCNRAPFCPNCNQEGHTALSTECPKYSTIQKILKFQAENGGSFAHARECLFPKDTPYKTALLSNPTEQTSV